MHHTFVKCHIVGLIDHRTCLPLFITLMGVMSDHIGSPDTVIDGIVNTVSCISININVTLRVLLCVGRWLMVPCR